MYNVNSAFHALATADSPETRIRLYWIDDTVDCTDDADVTTNGTLLKWSPLDTDSNGRISESGITITERFNNDSNLAIGETVSSEIQLTLMNSDGALDGFTYGRCKIYIDVYDDANSTWRVCPVGVFIIDIPTRRKVQLVQCRGYDQMQLLDEIADGWWNDIDWDASPSPTISDILTSMATDLGIHLNSNISNQIVNGSVSYTLPPITGSQLTYRNILAQIAGATGTNAFFDRDGALNLKWFEEVFIGVDPVEINTDTLGNTCLSLDIAEYAVAPIDALQVLAMDADLGTTVGDGGNCYQIVGNGFINGADQAEIATKATPILSQMMSLVAYLPITINVIADWSIEAGDVIHVITDSYDRLFPIFQQTLTWRGGYVFSEMMSSGDPHLPVLKESVRDQYRLNTLQRQFEVELDTFRSKIQGLEQNYTDIHQTVDDITVTVQGHDITVQEIINQEGAVWQAIQNNKTFIENVDDALSNEVTQRTSYIRFIPAEPAIVLGVDTGNEIKLKIVNNIIYFFSGDDDSTNLGLAYAYFNSNETGTRRVVAEESTQIGSDNTTYKWLWKMLTNGDLVLDKI